MNTYIRRIILLFLFHFTLLVFCKAQNPLFKNYGVKEGLPSSEAYEVFQDSKGYIWIATDGGVSRFDGYEFKTFTTEDGLADNVNFGFYEDHKGRIWLKSYSNKLCYYSNGNFHAVHYKTQLPSKQKHLICRSMYVDKTDTLWVGFDSAVGYMKAGLNGSTNEIDPRIISFEAEGVLYLKKIKTDGLLFGTSGGKSARSKSPEIACVFIKEDNTQVVTAKISGETSIAAVAIKMAKSKRKTFFLSIGHTVHEFSANAAISLKHFPYNIISLAEDKAGNFWMGTRNNGVFFYKDYESCISINFLKQLSVTSIIEDNEGGYWFSTLESGIFYLANINFKNYTVAEGLSNNKINCISISPKNKLWLGLNNGKVNSIENGKIISEFNCNLIPNNVNNISSIQCLNNELVVVGGGCLSIIKNNKPPVIVRDTQSVVLCTRILPLDGRFIIANYSNFTEITPINGAYKFQRHKLENRIYSLMKSKTGGVWMGTTNGLSKYEDNQVEKYLDGKLNVRIDDLKEDKNNYIWGASKGKGLVVINDTMVLYLNKKNGLANNFCSNIFIDDENIIWAGTNNGISKIKVKSYQPFTYEIKNYSTADGLISNEVNQIIVNGDSVYVATNNGLTIFNKKENKPANAKLPLYITKFQVKDSTYSLQNEYQLEYDQNFIRVHFIALSYKVPGSVDYKYRLVGLDTSWHIIKNTFVDFTTLPYGTYSFEVLARNNGNDWNSKLIKINFTIATPYWHTWWFRIVLGIFALVGVLLAVRHRIRLIENRANEKTDLYQKAAEAQKEKLELYQKATDMEIKFLASQMNPHFTFNAMNSIQKFILNKEPLAAQRYLAQYSKLIRRVLENNMKQFVKFEQEIEMLELYLEIEAARFERKFDFEIVLSEELEEMDVEIPPMIIQPYIENAIWHGLANKEDGSGKIELRFSLEKDCVKCVVEDNGIGREKAATFKFKKEHTSLGMLITSQRLQHLHSNTHLGIQNTVSDLKTAEGIALGTKVEVYLPIYKKHE